jgi:hypothetical protein
VCVYLHAAAQSLKIFVRIDHHSRVQAHSSDDDRDELNIVVYQRDHISFSGHVAHFCPPSSRCLTQSPILVDGVRLSRNIHNADGVPAQWLGSVFFGRERLVHANGRLIKKLQRRGVTEYSALSTIKEVTITTTEERDAAAQRRQKTS